MAALARKAVADGADLLGVAGRDAAPWLILCASSCGIQVPASDGALTKSCPHLCPRWHRLTAGQTGDRRAPYGQPVGDAVTWALRRCHHA